MPRDDHLYLADIKLSCEKIIKYTHGMSRETFFQDELTYDAVLRNLLVIGEAAKNLGQNLRDEYKGIEWKKICGLRDIIAHAYFGIDNNILWDIIKSKIPSLLNELSV